MFELIIVVSVATSVFFWLVLGLWALLRDRPKIESEAQSYNTGTPVMEKLNNWTWEWEPCVIVRPGPKWGDIGPIASPLVLPDDKSKGEE